MGGIQNSGLISGHTGIDVNSISTFSGGISNSGTISASSSRGIYVGSVAQFGSGSVGGGISNSGTISSGGNGINLVNDTSFLGGISNSGTIYLHAITTFFGGITNSGTLTAAHGSAAISVGGVTTFLGAINNSGTIIAPLGNGVFVSNVSQFGSTSAGGGITNSGTISGAGGIILGNVTFVTGSDIVNSGTIIATVGTAIDASVNPSAITIDILGGAITGNIVGNGTTGGDTLNFALGNGTFTYNSSFENFEAVNIDSGTVVLNGASNSAMTVNVNAGGTLAGNGTIDPPVGNGIMVYAGGTLEPGTPGTAGGTLTITGSLTFAPGADYEIQLSPSAHGSATVSGNLALGGGTVELAPSGPLGAHYAATTFSILTYGGTLTGTFNPNVIYAGAVGLSTTPTISYVPNNVDLSYGNAIADLATPSGANQNEQNVINGINNGILTGDIVPAGFQQLGGLSGAALLNAYSLLDGEDATGASTSTFQLFNSFFNLLSDMALGTGGGGGANPGSGASGFAEPDGGFPPELALAYNRV
ncbi:MAG: hypothetical protein WBD71_07220 [Xanthobacteraceae bacterium]